MVTKNTKQKEAKQNDKNCKDKNCPIHGDVKVRGRSFVGTVISDKMSKTVVVGWTRRFFVKKFERYERRQSKINAHNPDCIDAKKGDVVRISETRPLSKTKHFTIVEIIGQETKKEHIKTETIEEETAKEAITLKKREEKQAKSDEE
jgi:small subunit ribosomal protein S17